jgi:hypothetical protein
MEIAQLVVTSLIALVGLYVANSFWRQTEAEGCREADLGISGVVAGHGGNRAGDRGHKRNFGPSGQKWLIYRGNDPRIHPRKTPGKPR